MYNVYVTKGDKYKEILILAKKRVRFEGDTKFLEGLCIGNMAKPGTYDNRWRIGYHTKAWGSKQFRLLGEDEQITIKSKNRIFAWMDNIYINTDRGLWEISKNRDIDQITEEEADEKTLRYMFGETSLIDQFKIKNLIPLNAR